jgi:hypothetical protein
MTVRSVPAAERRQTDLKLGQASIAYGTGAPKTAAAPKTQRCMRSLLWWLDVQFCPAEVDQLRMTRSEPSHFDCRRVT